jgi:hypothetical protein
LIEDHIVPFVDEEGPWDGPREAFGGDALFDFKVKRPYDTFEINRGVNLRASQFGNWVTAYTNTRLFGSYGNIGTRIYGHRWSFEEYHEPDDLGSRYFISAGVCMGASHEGSPESRILSLSTQEGPCLTTSTPC